MIIFSKKEKAGNQRRIFHKDTVRQAFWRAVPIMGSYLFVSMSYGLLMQEAGWKWDRTKRKRCRKRTKRT